MCASDYADDLRIGPEILKTTVETYRKLRNTIRWMLGNLAHFHRGGHASPYEDMPELERLLLHRLAELDAAVRRSYAEFDYKRIFAALNQFMTVDLSAFYFDIRKDALYCDPISSTHAQGLPHGARPRVPRHRDLARADALLHRGGGLARRGIRGAGSVHLEPFPAIPQTWRDEALAKVWSEIRRVRRVVTGALEIERAEQAHRLEPGGGAGRAHRRRRRCCGSSPPNSPATMARPGWPRSPSPRGSRSCRGRGRPMPSASMTCRAWRSNSGPAEGTKCARSWKILPRVGTDPDYPDVTPRDAQALREWDAAHARPARPRSRPRSRRVRWRGAPRRGATFGLGVMVALATAAIDQAVKLWLLDGFDLPGRGRVALAPFLDLVLAWNTGISYGLFQQTGPLGQWALFALKVVAVVLLAMWLARTAFAAVGRRARPDYRRRRSAMRSIASFTAR